MKKKKRTPRKFLQPLIVLLILALVSLIGLRRFNAYTARCQQVSDAVATVASAQSRWYQSPSGTYIVHSPAVYEGKSTVQFYTADTCHTRTINLNTRWATDIKGWSPDESYLVIASARAGSSGCRTLDIFTGDGRSHIFGSNACNQGDNFAFLEWHSDHDLTLYTSDSGSSQRYHATIINRSLVVEPVALYTQQ